MQTPCAAANNGYLSVSGAARRDMAIWAVGSSIVSAAAAAAASAAAAAARS